MLISILRMVPLLLPQFGHRGGDFSQLQPQLKRATGLPIALGQHLLLHNPPHLYRPNKHPPRPFADVFFG